jgi:hypothetical protein
MERLKDLILKNFDDRKKEESNKVLYNNRKEVQINANGTSGYKIKEGINKDKVLGHMTTKSKAI